MGYLQDRERRIAGFEETLELCERDIILAFAIWQTTTRTRCYRYKDNVLYKWTVRNGIQKIMTDLSWIRRGGCQAIRDNIFVTQQRSLEAVRRMRTLYPQSRIAVLQSASGTNPGGGVIRGGVGQEEDLCRCSTLYPCIQANGVRRHFYDLHRRKMDFRYTDTCLYLPGIIGIREEVPDGALLPEADWYFFDIIACAAPNMRMHKWKKEGIYDIEASEIDREEEWLIEQRARRIIRTAICNRVDILVLDTFGCGMYGNSPDVVAYAFKKTLNEYQYPFRAVIFAICSDSEVYYNSFSAIL